MSIVEGRLWLCVLQENSSLESLEEEMKMKAPLNSEQEMIKHTAYFNVLK